jgi:hypothetical protein
VAITGGNPATDVTLTAKKIDDRSFDLRAIRIISSESANRSFMYPRSAANPGGSAVRTSFKLTADSFTSSLARHQRRHLRGDRTSAGGVAKELDLDGDGTSDVTFDKECGFVIPLRKGQTRCHRIGRDVSGAISGYKLAPRAFKPQDVK